MSRPLSENTMQVAFKIRPEAVELAERIAKRMTKAGKGIGVVTKTEVLRAALEKGLRGMK